MALPSPLPPRNGVNATRLRLPSSGAGLPGDLHSAQDYVLARFGHVDPDGIRARFACGEVVARDGTPLTPDTPLGVHEDLWYYRDVPHEAALPVHHTLLHRDEHLVVIHKPHFLPTTPGGRFVQETALVRLRNELGLDHLVPLHRLDRATAGVVMFSANPATRGAYHLLFERRAVTKRYEAIALLPEAADSTDHTGPDDGAWHRDDALLARFPLTVRSRIRKDKGILRSVVEEIPAAASGRRAGAPVRTRKSNQAHLGANAESRVEVLDVGTSAGSLTGRRVVHLGLTPHTGRTHQLRIHLAALGLGIAFDPFYPDLLDAAPDDFARPLQLLSRSVAFTDPVTGEPREFTSPAQLQERPQ